MSEEQQLRKTKSAAECRSWVMTAGAVDPSPPNFPFRKASNDELATLAYKKKSKSRLTNKLILKDFYKEVAPEFDSSRSERGRRKSHGDAIQSLVSMMAGSPGNASPPAFPSRKTSNEQLPTLLIGDDRSSKNKRSPLRRMSKKGIIKDIFREVAPRWDDDTGVQTSEQRRVSPT
jgi:ribosomal protein L17